MNKSIFILIVYCAFLLACCSKHLQRQNPSIVHQVFFDLKSDVDSNAFIQVLSSMHDIKEIRHLEIKHAIDLQDERAMSNYDLLLIVHFNNAADYRGYQLHPIHINLKKTMSGFLAAPPVTYDYSY